MAAVPCGHTWSVHKLGEAIEMLRRLEAAALIDGRGRRAMQLAEVRQRFEGLLASPIMQRVPSDL